MGILMSMAPAEYAPMEGFFKTQADGRLRDAAE